MLSQILDIMLTYSFALVIATKAKCFVLPKIRGNAPARYIEYDSWKLPADMIYANPGFAHSECVHVLIAAERLFHLLRLDRYIGDGRFPHTPRYWVGLDFGGTQQRPVQSFGEATTSRLTVKEKSLNAQLQSFWAV